MTARTAEDPSPLLAAVRAALSEVRDPELDEPITELGFLASCDVGPAGSVRARLRLPTFFCAPNFVFMMVADAREAIARVPGVSSVDVGVVGHFAAKDINGGVAGRRTFVGTFGDQAEAELDGVRVDFLRKAVLAAADRVCRPLLAAGRGPTELAALTLADPPGNADLQRLRDRRRQLGLPTEDGSPLLVDLATGGRVAEGDVAMHLHRARLTRTSMEANGELCRSLLQRRYAGTPISIRSPSPRAGLTTGHDDGGDAPST